MSRTVRAVLKVRRKSRADWRRRVPRQGGDYSRLCRVHAKAHKLACSYSPHACCAVLCTLKGRVEEERFHDTVRENGPRLRRVSANKVAYLEMVDRTRAIPRVVVSDGVPHSSAAVAVQNGDRVVEEEVHDHGNRHHLAMVVLFCCSGAVREHCLRGGMQKPVAATAPDIGPERSDMYTIALPDIGFSLVQRKCQTMFCGTHLVAGYVCACFTVRHEPSTIRRAVQTGFSVCVYLRVFVFLSQCV